MSESIDDIVQLNGKLYSNIVNARKAQETNKSDFSVEQMKIINSIQYEMCNIINDSNYHSNYVIDVLYKLNREFGKDSMKLYYRYCDTVLRDLIEK